MRQQRESYAAANKRDIGHGETNTVGLEAGLSAVLVSRALKLAGFF